MRMPGTPSRRGTGRPAPGWWAALSLLPLMVGCPGETPQPAPSPAPIAISLSASSITVLPDGTPASVDVTVQRPAGNTNLVTLTTTSATGITAQITSPGAGDSGKVVFAAQNAPAGPVTVSVVATEGTASTSASLALDVPVMAVVSQDANTDAGFNGRLQNFMATSFQPAEWDYEFFASHPGAATALGSLQSQHIRLQPVSGGVPQKADQSWDFTMLDAILDPVIQAGDKSPELQLATAPAWMNDASGHLMPAHFADFADYAANVVRYYNTTAGFQDSRGITHVHSATNPTPIARWGIFNEPNINGLSPTDYVNLYNVVAPAMQAAGSLVPLKFVAVELSDWGNEPQRFLPVFVNAVTAQVDAIGTHYYSSCNQSDSDTAVFAQITSTFVAHVEYIYQQLKTVPRLAEVPVWVTENNVNADYQGAGGYSTCNPAQKFVLDQRGTSAFFAAWRGYLFSQLGKAGAQSIYHWDFDADAQYGEVDFGTGNTYLSYWVDYYLQRYFPFCDPGGPPGCTSTGSTILRTTSTEQPGAQTVELLATRNADGSVVLMLSDHAVSQPSDNNGKGAPRTVMLDVSALGPFATGTQLTLDAKTDPAAGPVATGFTPAGQLTVRLGGYGTTFLTLSNGTASPGLAPHSRSAAGDALAAVLAGAGGSLPASDASAAASPTLVFTSNPPVVAVGLAATLTWSATGAASCVASGDWSGPRPVEGSLTVVPAMAGTYGYVLSCTGPGGSVARSATVAVIPSGDSPTPAVEPAAVSMAVSPNAPGPEPPLDRP
jgi:hypothetical protein